MLVAVSFHWGCGESAEPARSDRATSHATRPAADGGGSDTGAAGGSAGSGGAAGQLGPAPSDGATCSTVMVEPGRSATPVECEFPIVWSRTVKARQQAALPRVEVAVDGDANLYLAASLEGEVEWNGERIGAAGRDSSFIASYTPAGELRSVHAIDESRVRALAVHVERQVCVAVELLAPTALPEQQNLEEHTSSLVQCWDLGGSPRWARGMRGFIHEMVFDRAGNLLVVSFEPNPEPDQFSEFTTLSSFTADGSPRWSKLVTRTGGGATLAAHPDGSFVFATEFRDSLELGSMRWTNPRQFPSIALASIDSEGNGLWGVVEDWSAYSPELVVAPTGDILMWAGAAQRYDRTGARLGDRVEAHIHVAFAGGYLSTTGARMDSRIGWTLERFSGDLQLQSVTTYEPAGGTAGQSSAFAVPVIAPTGDAYLAAIHGEVVAIARIDLP